MPFCKQFAWLSLNVHAYYCMHGVWSYWHVTSNMYTCVLHILHIMKINDVWLPSVLILWIKMKLVLCNKNSEYYCRISFHKYIQVFYCVYDHWTFCILMGYLMLKWDVVTRVILIFLWHLPLQLCFVVFMIILHACMQYVLLFIPVICHICYYVMQEYY